MSKVYIDSPLLEKGGDLFHRGALVDLLVDSIKSLAKTSHPCTVYGIYGRWGEGKTSLMNFVEQDLRKTAEENSIKIVKFNPWLVGSEESLLREFFNTIIPTADGKLRALFRQYGSLAVFASKTIVNAFVPAIGSALGDGIEMARRAYDDSESTLAQLKNKIIETINGSGKHVLVIIDDVDRLDKNEVHSVMRLVRQVADFDNFIYMIGMDVDMVAKSLGDYFGEGGKYAGRSFIDKIVQVPITLPVVSDLDMRSIVSHDLHDVLADYAGEDEIDEIAEKVKRVILTRRDLFRYSNQLSFVLPNLKSEVNVEDLCLLEAVKLISNEAYDEIYRSRASLLMEAQGLDHYPSLEKRTEVYERRRKDAIDAIAKKAAPQRVYLLKPILDFLFSESSSSRQSNKQKRLVSSFYFYKYFTQTVPSNIIPDSELNAFEKRLSEISNDELINWLNLASDSFSFVEVGRACLYLIDRNDSASQRRLLASRLAKGLSLSKIAKGYPAHINPDRFDIATFVAIRIVYDYLLEQDPDYAGMKVSDRDLLDETLFDIFTRAEMNYCLSMLASSDYILGTREYDGKRPVLALCDRFKLESFPEQFSRSKFLLITLFESWKRLDPESFTKYINGLVDSSDDTYVKVLDKFIDSTEVNLFDLFIKLFESVIPSIVERINKSDDSIWAKDSVRVFMANYNKFLALEVKDE